MATSSLQYWEERWAKDPWNFATSWPDTYARLLECAFIKHILQTKLTQGVITEFGCGNLQLAEDNELFLMLGQRGYHFWDGSPAALKVAQQRMQCFSGNILAGGEADFTDPKFHEYLTARGACKYKPAEIVLTKRTLQNLKPEERKAFWPFVLEYRHGIVIEGTCESLIRTNIARTYVEDLGNCTPPAFNWYLQAAEIEQLMEKTGAIEYPFLGYYYLKTRGERDLKEWDSEIHREAYREQLKMIEEGDYSYRYGPVTAFVW